MIAARNILLCLALAVAALPIAAGKACAEGIGLPGPRAMTTVSSAETSAKLPNAVSTPQGADITDENYRLGTGDKVRITVYGESDLSGEFVVDSSGQTQIPLVGQVRAAGLTIHQFIAEVADSLSPGYLKDPKISVEVLNYRPFYIMGEVNKPGEYPYENGLSVPSAIALAGGYTYRANESEVHLRHAGDAKELSLPADPTTKVQPGDIIRISERLF